MSQLQKKTEQVFLLTGDASIGQVIMLSKESQILWQAKELTIDFSQVTKVDTSTLALLLDWTRMAKQKNIRLQFVHIPPAMQSLLEVSGIHSLLPIA